MNDTRVLLNRIAQFRKRIEEMPRLIHAPESVAPALEEGVPMAEIPEAAARGQAILEYSLRQLADAKPDAPAALSDRARRLLADAQGLVTRLKAMADEPMLMASPEVATSTADPLVVHFRETAAMTEAAVRYAATLPESVTEQVRLCEGLEGMIDAARRRFDLLAATLERRRVEINRVDTLARFFCALSEGSGTIDATPIIELADALLADEHGRPLRLMYSGPLETQAYLGGTEFRAPSRFVAAHALNCGCVAARIARNDAEWKSHDRELVLACLLHDVGMVSVDPALLGKPEPLTDGELRQVEAHTHRGADWIINRLPRLSWAAEVAANHHERADGKGYPGSLINDQVSILARLVAAIDVYSAMCSPRPHRAASDTRAAMTDVLLTSERGSLDRHAVEKLLCLGLYPAGSVVELADGSTAVVLASQDPRSKLLSAGRPAVAVLADPVGRAYPNPRFIDLADSNSGNVIRTLGPIDRWQRIGRSYPEWA